MTTPTHSRGGRGAVLQPKDDVRRKITILSAACLSVLLGTAPVQIQPTSVTLAAGRTSISVPKWSIYEVCLEARKHYSNPYTEAALTATFRGPGNITQTRSGFWDGDNMFRVRFTPTAQGTWSFTTSSSDPGLNGRTGSFRATAALAGNHGFLRVDSKYKNSFVWDDGTRYFMWGQTADNIVLSALVNSNWKRFIDKSAGYGITKLRFNVYADYWEPAVHHGYADVQPYTGSTTSPNRDELNFASLGTDSSNYWQKLDEIVQYLETRGMVAELIFASPYQGNSQDPGKGNRQFGTNTQNDRFFKYVTARYAACHNVTWNLCWEWQYSAIYGGSYPQSKNDFNRLGTIVLSTDPWLANGALLRPLTSHQQTRIDFQFFDASWPTYVGLQYGVRNKEAFTNGDQWANAGIVYNLPGQGSGNHGLMPVVNDEYGYIAEVNKIKNETVIFSQTQQRNAMWGVAVAGGYGSIGDERVFTDGSNEWLPPTATSTSTGSLRVAVEGSNHWMPLATGEWGTIDAPEYGDVKRLVDFFTSKGIEYWKMSSHNELVTSGTRVYVLAEPGRQYVIYAAAGGKFSLDIAEGRYVARRYNPRTGEDEALAEPRGGGSQPFAVPDANDWVVYLKTSRE